MRMGIRARLLLVSVVLLVSGLGPGLLWLERQLRLTLEDRIEAELLVQAQLSREIVARGQTQSQAAVDQLADALGRITDARVTLIAADGMVLGDSELPMREVREMDNHGTRPEVVQLMGQGPTGVGISRRYSTTLQTEMLYLAMPSRLSSGPTVVRLALPLDEVNAQVTQVRVALVLSVLIGLVVVLLQGALAVQWLTRDLRALVGKAKDLAGQPVMAVDEIALLTGSFDVLSREIERTVVEQAERRRQFEDVITAMTDGLLAIDKLGTIVVVNRAARELLAMEDAVEGQTVLEATGLVALQEVTLRGLEGEPDTLEFDVRDGRDEVRQMRVVVAPQDGGGVLLVVREVTELRRLETIRRDFVANVSHELRTPVTAIQSSAEALQDGALEHPEMGRRFVDAILRNATRLGSLLADLLQLSRVEAGRFELDTSVVKVDEVVTRVLLDLEPRIAQRGHVATNQVAPEVSVMGDEGALEQVLMNLVDNAVKYTPEGSRIVVRSRTEEGRVRIEVADNGPGIPAHYRTRLFERFYRVDPGRSQAMGGTGLGLAIVRHLVELMGGRVGMASGTPSGAVFWLVLPAGRHEEG